jgi:hypothetical protein
MKERLFYHSVFILQIYKVIISGQLFSFKKEYVTTIAVSGRGGAKGTTLKKRDNKNPPDDFRGILFT